MVVCVSRRDGNRRESVRTALFGSKRSLEGIIVLGLEAAFSGFGILASRRCQCC